MEHAHSCHHCASDTPSREREGPPVPGRIGLAAALLLAGWLLEARGLALPGRVTLVASLLLSGWPVIGRGIRGMARGSFDIDGLVTVAAAAAPFIGEWVEAALVMLLFAVGEGLEELVSERNRRSLEALLDSAPRFARVRRGTDEVEVPAEHLVPGDVFLLRPGDRAPADGRVVAGSSALDEAAITGEAFPVPKAVGDGVYAGSINREGFLEVEVTHRAAESTFSRMIRLVEEAQEVRAPSQRLVDRFARYYTPAVIAAAATMALVPLLTGAPWHAWMYRALALLLVSCPCALVISTPTAIVAAISAAARRGILIKGGTHLEAMGRLRVLAFDKTGTLTLGSPRLVEVIAGPGHSEGEILALAAAVEAASEHPIARALVREAGERGIRPSPAKDFRAIPGLGARARVDGRECLVGNARLFAGWQVPDGVARGAAALQASGPTAVLAGCAGEVWGALAVADTVRPGAREAVARLKKMGIGHLAMLTGDHLAPARAVARDLDLDSVRHELLPEQKVQAVRDLRTRYGEVGMVGDGVNDTAALAAASLGVAMGAAGTEAALETADVALMGDDLGTLPDAVALGRRTLHVIGQNVALAVGVKLLALVLLALGRLDLWMAVLSDSGTAVLVTLNSMRLLRGPARAGRGLPSPGQETLSPP
ncbi:MAG: heavy metal translocating P-type ATPase [Bacillota bacterium]|nr:heavy metal translocating P-type ATPase [Bacillota bacterium]